jgi:sialate O-acetylesterase
MVVQRDVPVHVWGSASPGESITVAFRGNRQATVAAADGRWHVYLPPGGAGGPFEMSITGRNTITLKDVMAGDVWIASGQSNMEWPVRWSADPEREMAAASHPNIRLVRTMHRTAEFPLGDFAGTAWAPCSPQSVEHFSAVAYQFGRNLHERLRVPIGLIQTAWGGTPLEAWTRLGAIADDPELTPVLAEWARSKKQTAHWRPGALFHAMVAPLTALPVRGVIWYQGEANTDPDRAPYYEDLFETMIRDWREAWGQADLPFLFVQLANYIAPPDSMWPEVREAQQQALALSETGMAVAIDIGTPDDIHPRNKREVGHRLALAARAIVYGEQLEFSGPLFRRAVREGNAMRVWFDHAGGGLKARGGQLREFEIAGADGKYVPGIALIDGDTIAVSSPLVPRPAYVRYAWKDNPSADLYNSAGLPASPFRSDSL